MISGRDVSNWLPWYKKIEASLVLDWAKRGDKAKRLRGARQLARLQLVQKSWGESKPHSPKEKFIWESEDERLQWSAGQAKRFDRLSIWTRSATWLVRQTKAKTTSITVDYHPDERRKVNRYWRGQITQKRRDSKTKLSIWNFIASIYFELGSGLSLHSTTAYF